jgi:transcriptional accessory protein Tex/SPT6
LDEVQIKQISDEYQYVANLQKRKDEVIHNIEQGTVLFSSSNSNTDFTCFSEN